MASDPHYGTRPLASPEASDSSSSNTAADRRTMLDIGPEHSKGLRYAPIRSGSDFDRTSSREIVPIGVDDRAELMRLASALSPSKSYTSTQLPDELERKDTLGTVEFGDPVLDPSKPEFDVYKWARMLMRTMDEEGVKARRAGFTFKHLNVSGSGSALNLQKNVGSVFMAPLRLREYIHFGKKPEKRILRNFDGVVKSGEMLVVLGRPGSGCSTLLKTVCGEFNGLLLDQSSVIHYNGIPQEKMLKEFKGEVAYNKEVDQHFPHLTVGQTLEFAAAARTPHNRVRDVSRKTYVGHMAKVVMAVFGLSHTRNTKVGNDFVRGVSGGERKR
ncbi:MAG: hypothetical protein M1830_005158, partial [Pleopsidium flavum]